MVEKSPSDDSTSDVVEGNAKTPICTGGSHFKKF